MMRTYYVSKLPEKVDMDPNVLYVSYQLQAAAHMCPCGCEDRIEVPIDSSGWHVSGGDSPTVAPSFYNKCNSHYFIRDGRVMWI